MRRLKQFVFLLEALAQPGGLRAFLTWKPFSITSFRMINLLKKNGHEFRTIIDGGANKGQFARAAAEIFAEARVFAFEPLPDVAQSLRRNLQDCTRVEVQQFALGPRDGTTKFYRKSYTLASSVLKPIGSDESSDVVQTEVAVSSLDTALREFALEPPVLLKLDLQGYEIEALRGAPETLRQTQCVLVETAFTRGYEQEPVFDDVVVFLRDAGFEFERPIDVLVEKDGEIVQIDALFRRVDAPASYSSSSP